MPENHAPAEETPQPENTEVIEPPGKTFTEIIEVTPEPEPEPEAAPVEVTASCDGKVQPSLTDGNWRSRVKASSIRIESTDGSDIGNLYVIWYTFHDAWTITYPDGSTQPVDTDYLHEPVKLIQPANSIIMENVAYTKLGAELPKAVTGGASRSELAPRTILSAAKYKTGMLDEEWFAPALEEGRVEQRFYISSDVETGQVQSKTMLVYTPYGYSEDEKYDVRNRIETFIDDADKLAILVDCENSDPFALHNALMSFSEETKRKINRIVLIRDDTYTVSAWKMFQSISTDIEVEDICVTRLKTTKSLTDVKLCAAAFNLYYEQGVKSFVLASSDSDYFGLIDSLPDDAQFCVFAQRNKTAGVFKEALTNLQIPYCYIEDFFGDNSGELMKRAVRKELRIRISEISFNTLDLLRSSARAAGAKPSEEELTNMLNDAIADLQLTFDKTSGIARIVDRTEVRAG